MVGESFITEKRYNDLKCKYKKVSKKHLSLIIKVDQLKKKNIKFIRQNINLNEENKDLRENFTSALEKIEKHLETIDSLHSTLNNMKEIIEVKNS